MALCRILLAALIALAVTVAPVGAAFATAQSPAKAAVDDCHKKPAKNTPAKCPGDGSKCCKLTGTIVSLPSAPAVAVAIDRTYDPQKPPDWKLGPRPPPPRS